MNTFKYKGVLLFSLAMLISGTIGLFVRWVELPSIEIVFYRCLIGAIVLGVYAILFEKRAFSKIVDKKLLIFMSAIILVFNWVFLFAAFKHTSISIAISIYYLAPIFVMLYGVFVLKEKDVKIKLFTVFIAFIGAILVSGLFSNTHNTTLLGILYAFIAAILYASLIVVASKLKNTPPTLLALIQTTIGAIILFFFVPETFSHLIHIKYDMLKILIILGAVHTALMYILFFKGVQLAPVSAVALLGFLDPLVAVLIDFTILHSHISLTQWIGIILIMSALIIKTLYGVKR